MNKANPALKMTGLAIISCVLGAGPHWEGTHSLSNSLGLPGYRSPDMRTQSSIDIFNIDLGKRAEGLNIFRATLRNNSSAPELVVLDIRSSHGGLYPGWQRQFPYSLNAGETKALGETYEIFDINKESYVRIRLYNPKANETPDEGNCVFQKNFPYEDAKKYVEPLINVFDEKTISLWDDKPNPYLKKRIRTGQIRLDFVDLGGIEWGVNKYSLLVTNLGSTPRKLKLRLWTRYESSRGAINISRDFALGPFESKKLEGWYLVSLDHGRLEVLLSITDAEDNVLARKYTKEFTPLPNKDTRSLLSVYHKAYPGFKYIESKNFIIYFMPGSTAEKDSEMFLREHELILSNILNTLKIAFKGKVVYFLYPTSFAKISLTFHAGWGLAYKNTIVEEYVAGQDIDPFHELTHIVSRRIGNPSALFNEGLAVSMQRGSRWEGKEVDTICGEYLERGTLIPLTELVCYTEIGPEESMPEIAYPEAGSFIKFLIRAFGMNKFKTLYAHLKNTTDPRQQIANMLTIESIYGRSLAHLEQDWIAHLRPRPVPDDLAQ